MRFARGHFHQEVTVQHINSAIQENTNKEDKINAGLGGSQSAQDLKLLSVERNTLALLTNSYFGIWARRLEALAAVARS